MRKFYLENETGTRFDLQQINKVVLLDPSDLGFSIEKSYTQVGTRFILTKEAKKQKSITAKILFIGNYYNLYREFSNFVHVSKQLKLVYDCDDTEYFLDVDILSLSKSDPDEDGIHLESTIKMAAKSLYYLKKEKKYVLQNKTGGSRWDVQWDFYFYEATDTSIEIMNQGQTDASFSFEMFGYTEHPKLDVYYDGMLVNSIEFNIIVEQNEKLIFSNKDDDLYCQVISENGTVRNAFDCLDLNNDNFFKLKQGTSNLVFTAGTEISQINLAMYEEYEAV